ncbi:hypothetical protein [Streptomyces spiramenti]|uniref:Uncharacterized protein n=1 Tax=Streptomyces spiramenti TaxID=2720606 RepID=A0ABX1AC67_9ACTN|nr:hypothetical protein [Streptomyces spiramenti]NJP64794.1 hypothetical protein [Streptomyces spiramenti]
MAPIQHVRRWEIELALSEYLDMPISHEDARPTTERVLGRGVNHAFASPTGRLRLVSNIASDTVQEGEELDPEPDLLKLIDKARALPDDAYEWWSLAGNENDPMIYEDWETRGQHRIGDSFAHQERALSEHLAANPEYKKRLDDLIAAQEITEISESLHEVATEFDIDSNLIYGKLIEMGGPVAVKGFLRAMPASATVFEARRLKHRNTQWPWQQHDHIDLAALAVAIPYADIVVTERQWCHLFKVAKLDKKFRTQVTSRLRDIPELLIN